MLSLNTGPFFNRYSELKEQANKIQQVPVLAVAVAVVVLLHRKSGVCVGHCRRRRRCSTGTSIVAVAVVVAVVPLVAVATVVAVVVVAVVVVVGEVVAVMVAVVVVEIVIG